MESPPDDSLIISYNEDENVAAEEDVDEFQLITNSEGQAGEEEKKEENTNNAPSIDEINYDGT